MSSVVSDSFGLRTNDRLNQFFRYTFKPFPFLGQDIIIERMGKLHVKKKREDVCETYPKNVS